MLGTSSSSHPPAIPSSVQKFSRRLFVIVWSRVKVGRITDMLSRRGRNRQTKLLHDSLVSHLPCPSRLFSVLNYFTILLMENSTLEPTSEYYWLTDRRQDVCEQYVHAGQSHLPHGCMSIIVPRFVVILDFLSFDNRSSNHLLESKSFVG